MEKVALYLGRDYNTIMSFENNKDYFDKVYYLDCLYDIEDSRTFKLEVDKEEYVKSLGFKEYNEELFRFLVAINPRDFVNQYTNIIHDRVFFVCDNVILWNRYLVNMLFDSKFKGLIAGVTENYGFDVADTSVDYYWTLDTKTAEKSYEMIQQLQEFLKNKPLSRDSFKEFLNDPKFRRSNTPLPLPVRETDPTKLNVGTYEFSQLTGNGSIGFIIREDETSKADLNLTIIEINPGSIKLTYELSI